MTQVNFYSKEQTDELLDTKADKTDTYTKTEVNTALGTKANASDVYTKTEVDTALADKVDNATLNNYATKTYVDGKREFKPLTNTNWFTTLIDDTFNECDEFNVTEMTLANCTLIAQSKFYDENATQKRFNAVGFVVINNVYYPLRLISVIKAGGLRLDYVVNGALTDINADLTTSSVYKGNVVHYH